jgi:hypothetical protein
LINLLGENTMKHTVIYTRTYSVEVEADDSDHAITLWEGMDLDPAQDGGHLELQLVEWQQAGEWHSTYY